MKTPNLWHDTNIIKGKKKVISKPFKKRKRKKGKPNLQKNTVKQRNSAVALQVYSKIAGAKVSLLC